MRVAIASSGLGHVARGIETWALDSAVALSGLRNQAEGCGLKAEEGGSIEVALFAGAEARGQRTEVRGQRSGDAPGRGAPSTDHRPPSTALPVVILPCWRRSGCLSQWLARWSPGFAWRWGFKNPYGWEQLSFWLRLWPRLVQGRFDILHVQDPMVADWCRRFRRMGLVTTREILAHGTEEPAEFLARFEYLQHLAPWHLSQAEGCRLKAEGVAIPGGCYTGRRIWVAIPNFVDCGVFGPARSADERRAVRQSLGIPEGAFVVGCVAAVKKDHKRIDYLIREAEGYRLKAVGEELVLLIAGARTPESDELRRLADRCLPGQNRILLDCPRAQIPDLYRAMDVFVLPSLFEMMPIALLEAMASGLPCLVNRHPVLEWMIGKAECGNLKPESRAVGSERWAVSSAQRSEVGASEGNPPTTNSLPSTVHSLLSSGLAVDMSRDGALAAALAALTPEWLTAHGAAARQRAERLFSKEVVIEQYVEYYEHVMEGGENG